VLVSLCDKLDRCGSQRRETPQMARGGRP